jgi:hypothetical protein
MANGNGTTHMEQKEIEQILRKQKDKAGMLFTKLEYKERKKGILKAKIELNFNKIFISLNPNGWKDKLETAQTLNKHEIGHWETCPYDLSYHIEITSSIIEVAKEKLTQMDFSKKRGIKLIHKIANVFEDIVDNLFIEEHNLSEIYARISNTRKGKITKDFQFALGVQLQLWGTKEDYKLIMPLIGREPYEDATKYLEMIGLKKDDRLKKKRDLFEEKNSWIEYVNEFTKYYLKYYNPDEEKNQNKKRKEEEKDNKQENEEQKENDNDQEEDEQGNEEQKGNDNGQEEDEQGNEEQKGNNNDQEEDEQGNEEQKGNDNDQEEDEQGNDEQKENDNDQEEDEEGDDDDEYGEDDENDEDNTKPTIIIDNNPFDEDMKDMNKVRKAIGEIANRRGMGPAQKIVKNIINNNVDAMDILLDSISPAIEVKHKKEKYSFSFPLIPITKKFIEEDDVSATILGINIDNYGEPNLEVGKTYYPIDIQGIEMAKQIPDFLYIVDDSGSMGGLNVGDKYFMAMMGLYGTKNWLAKNGYINYVKFGLIQFSNTTRAWGFDYFENAREMKKLILNPQPGGTEIQIDIVKKLINEHDKKLVIIMLSDGDIANWKSINSEFINLIRPHQFAFVGIEGLGNAGIELQNKGFNVNDLSNPSKIHEITIDAAASNYSNY